MNRMASLAQRTPWRELNHSKEMVEEFTFTLHNELDYPRERRNADRIRANFGGNEKLYLPKVYWDYSTRRVLVLERNHGIKGENPGFRYQPAWIILELHGAGWFHSRKTTRGRLSAYSLVRTGYSRMSGHLSGGWTMTEGPGSKDIPPMFNDERVLTWMEEHLTELQQSASGQQVLYWALAISFVVGLVAHVGGYELLLSAPKEPLGLLADLLHALGWSLWTGVVVVVFIQVIPEAKRRQIRQTIDAYEALQRDKA